MMTRGWLLLLLLSGFISSVRAQVQISARFSASNPSPLVGERVRLVLTVEAPSSAIVTLPEFPTDWPPFVVESVGEITKSESGGMAIYRQTLTVILWRPGSQETPETFLQYQLSPADEALTIRVDPMLFTVPSVLDSADTVLRPLKPPVSLPYLPPWVVVVALVGLVGVARGTLWLRSRWLEWRARIGAIGATAYSPQESALSELRSIRERKPLPVVVYALVADCLRGYVQRRFQVNALDLTTDELMSALQAQDRLAKIQHRELQRMLEYADLVKFAHAEPGERAAGQLLNTAEKWVEGAEPPVNGVETTG